MTPEVAHFFAEFFKSIWNIFEAVTIPGTNFTAAELTIGLLGASAFIVVLRKILDDGGAVAFRSGEGKAAANKMIWSHRKYYGGMEDDKEPHEG